MPKRFVGRIFLRVLVVMILGFNGIVTAAEYTPEQEALLDRLRDGIAAQETLPMFCVRDEITPESTEFIQEILSIDDFTTRFNGTDSNRWMTTATNGGGITLGQPITLTWSIVPDGLNVDGPATPSNLRASFDAAFGSRAAWVNLIKAVFDEWGAKTGITYVQVSDDGAGFPSSNGSGSVRGDIRIGGMNIDGAGSGIIAFNYFPSGGGDMVIDTANTADTFAIPDNGFRLLKNTVSHEHGHGLGFGHACPMSGTKIMEPRLAENFDHSGDDDIANANRKYSDAYESLGRNETFGTASTIGGAVTQTVGDGSDSLRRTASIGSVSDQDFYALSLTAGDSLSFILRPRGSVYLYGDDNGQLCVNVSTSPLIANQVIDLDFEFIDVDGVTVIAQGTTNGVGAPEFIAQTVAAQTGTYYLRVYTNDAAAIPAHDQVQLYEIAIDVPGLVSAPVPATTGLRYLVMFLILLMSGIVTLRRASGTTF